MESSMRFRIMKKLRKPAAQELGSAIRRMETNRHRQKALERDVDTLFVKGRFKEGFELARRKGLGDDALLEQTAITIANFMSGHHPRSTIFGLRTRTDNWKGLRDACALMEYSLSQGMRPELDPAIRTVLLIEKSIPESIKEGHHEDVLRAQALFGVDDLNLMRVVGPALESVISSGRSSERSIADALRMEQELGMEGKIVSPFLNKRRDQLSAELRGRRKRISIVE